MTSTRTTNALLLMIALALIALAAKPLLSPAPVAAQAGNDDPFYVEPGVYLLRSPDAGGQVLGKVTVNLRTGIIWGFPTNNSDPYPTSPIDSKQQVSHPIMLGRFALNEARGK